ncbi:MAG: DinB family protein [Armatimonadota bacterium]
MNDMALYGLTATHTRIHRCLEDIAEEDARRSPIPGLAPIVWQVGHLAWADFGFARRADGRTEMPDGYEGLFKPGTGTGGEAYPSLDEVKNALDRAHRSLESVACSIDFGAPVEARNYSTVGEMLVFVCYHRGYHIGKMTTLRALLKKPRLFG